jgi:hypothetical protein
MRLDGRTRTSGLALPKRAPCHSATPSCVEKVGINPLRQRLQGAPAPLAVIPVHGPAAAQGDGAGRGQAARPWQGRADVSPLWSWQCASPFTLAGGAGREGRRIENRPSGNSPGAVPVAWLRSLYVGTLTLGWDSIGHDIAAWSAPRSMPFVQAYTVCSSVCVRKFLGTSSMRHRPQEGNTLFGG